MHAGILVGLRIDAHAETRLVVGCSIRTPAGDMIDLPARYVDRDGLAWWGRVDGPDECRTGEYVDSDWRGDIIFALYSDSTFADRLSDTGWTPWHAMWMIGSSRAGIDYTENYVRGKYGSSLEWPGEAV